jgi:hypothetical protein
VMNMVSLLIIGLILPYDKTMLDALRNLKDSAVTQGLQELGVATVSRPLGGLFWGVVVVGIVGLAWSIWQSKRETPEEKAQG